MESRSALLRLRFLLFVLATVLGVAAATPAYAQPDEEGCADHPLFSRMPGFYLSSCEDQEFSAHTFYLDDDERRVEGRYWRLDFWIKDGLKAPGPLQIGRNYWNLMAARGGTRLHESLEAGGGTLVASMPGPNRTGTVWLEVSVSNSGEAYTLTVVQEAGMRQDVTLSAAELAEALARDGTITLRNILFDTGKATLTAGSTQALDAVVELLRRDTALRLLVQGHTDNVGNPAANLTLSADRARAVKAYLVSAGIDAGRLDTAGLGDAQPVADNATEDGRAQNRRVVLVRQ
ncbi:MAG: OmpA family protein [Vicinamibacterales bacterium]|nr:OmpA family protein [Vicinamibacterales bacterium]